MPWGSTNVTGFDNASDAIVLSSTTAQQIVLGVTPSTVVYNATSAGGDVEIKLPQAGIDINSGESCRGTIVNGGTTNNLVIKHGTVTVATIAPNNKAASFTFDKHGTWLVTAKT